MERVGGGAKGSPVTAGQPFRPLVRAFTAGTTLPNRFAPPRRDANPRTRDLSPTDRRIAEELRDTRGSRAVQVLLALAAPKKGYGAPGAGCPVINYGYSCRRPGLEAVCINFGQRYAAAAPHQPALAA